MRRRSILVLAISATAMGASARKYFPIGGLSSDSKMDGIKAAWYSQELGTLGEPSIWQLSQQRPTNTEYRFLWLRSFNAPICVRLTVNKDGTGSLTFKEGSAHVTAERGKLNRVRISSLSSHQVRAFLDKVVTLRFWDLPSPNPNNPVFAVDGSQWIIESANKGSYKLVDIWSAPANNPVRVLGEMLMSDLAHVHLPAELVY